MTSSQASSVESSKRREARGARGRGIGARLWFAFVVVILLHALFVVFAFVVHQQSVASASDAHGVTGESLQILGAAQAISEFQLAVAEYERTGSRVVERRARTLADDLIRSLEREFSGAAGRALRRPLAALREQAVEYAGQLTDLADDRAALERADVSGLLAEIAALYSQEHGEEAGDRFLSSLVRAGEAARAYAAAPHGSEIRAFTLAVSDARGSLSSLSPSSEAPLRLAEIPGMLDRCAFVFDQRCDVTRRRLHLSSVVMPETSSEVLRRSYEAREHLRGWLDARHSEARRRLAARQSWGVAFAVVSVLVMLVVACVFTRGVTGPLARVVASFRRIASGEYEFDIPELDRDDEIGRVAAAADAFRRRSIESQGLISETKRLAEEIERKGREIESFVYSASHDLKSPLVSLMGYLGYLRGDLAQGRVDRAEGFLDRVDEAGQRIRRNIEDLLALSRASAVPVSPERFSFGELADAALRDRRGDFEGLGVSCAIEGGEEALSGDRERLTDLLGNLVANALKYACSGDNPRISLSAERDGAWVVVRVADNGPGIDPEDHDRVFEMFERLGAGGEGTGLGLSIVRKIAEAHGGRVRVESALGAGATFAVRLPSPEV